MEQKDNKVIELNKDVYCWEHNFTERYKKWCEKYQHKNTAEDLKKMSQLIKYLNCEMRVETKLHPCVLPDEEGEYVGDNPILKTGKFIIGLRFKSNETQ